MKIKLILPMALMGCLLFFAGAQAKTHTTFSKSRAYIPLIFQQKTNAVKTASFSDSTNVYCWFDNNVPTDWTITFASTTGYYQFNVTGEGVIGKVPPGSYHVSFLCNDSPVPDTEIDASGYYYYGVAYLYNGNSNTGLYGVEVDNLQDFEIDFRPVLY